MSLRTTLAPALRSNLRPSPPSSSSSSASSSSRLLNPASRRLASNIPRNTTAPLTAQESSAAQQLDWPTYLALRRSQRLWGLIASIPTTLIGFSAGAGYFATIEADPTNTILGFEPVVIYGAATLGCVGLGWLAGPTVGGALWRLTHRRVAGAIEAKDKDFFRHISRWRADPSRQSGTSPPPLVSPGRSSRPLLAANPSPDYYAEKVGSLRQYRTWLRDQAAFKRKAQFGQGSDAVY
ncbi:Presequence translocated-associated motor subunit PAM17 [Rhodotorula diobovata]|uniref:Presequence translocated-associated motor subunit PAM17 n=1 Tax=Rhodotorula diobovata TaxID=5288 RepID=A0A5C5FY27_9BASI|nr:Presequence translocated-associated motor subunit PAM17 [Rhodotorula diobovata]